MSRSNVIVKFVNYDTGNIITMHDNWRDKYAHNKVFVHQLHLFPVRSTGAPNMLLCASTTSTMKPVNLSMWVYVYVRNCLFYFMCLLTHFSVTYFSRVRFLRGRHTRIFCLRLTNVQCSKSAFRRTNFVLLRLHSSVSSPVISLNRKGIICVTM
jgi:hypothetical protein